MRPDRAPPFTPGDKAIGKYLSDHAEKEYEAAVRLTLSSKAFGHAIAIPAQGEGEALAHRLERVPAGPEGPILIVAVINAGSEADPRVLESNQHSLEAIRARFGRSRLLAPHIRAYTHPSGQLIVIDRSGSLPLPPKQGVGLARKIGCDFILGAMESGHLTTPWIHCSDADTRLPQDYFNQATLEANPGSSALLYRFRHRPDPDHPSTYPLAQEYECSLRYYVLGLRFAASPHAFHSVGSALAIYAPAYARVRGFPRKEAAEDFYILNKLAKLGSVQQLAGAPIEPSSRSSDRVPFGTGAAIQKRLSAPQEGLHVYHPETFRYLQAWQAALCAHPSDPEQGQDLALTVLQQTNAMSGIDAQRLLAALAKSDALARAQRALQAPAPTRAQQLRDNLDSFRTLKVIHALRDAGLPPMPLRDALDRASFVQLSGRADHQSAESLARNLESLDYA